MSTRCTSLVDFASLYTKGALQPLGREKLWRPDPVKGKGDLLLSPVTRPTQRARTYARTHTHTHNEKVLGFLDDNVERVSVRPRDEEREKVTEPGGKIKEKDRGRNDVVPKSQERARERKRRARRKKRQEGDRERARADNLFPFRVTDRPSGPPLVWPFTHSPIHSLNSSPFDARRLE